MHWLYFLAALACLGLAMKTSLPAWAVLGLILIALGLLVAWMLGWMASRLAGVSRSDAHMVSVDDLRRLRQQAEARKQAAEGSSSEPQP